PQRGRGGATDGRCIREDAAGSGPAGRPPLPEPAGGWCPASPARRLRRPLGMHFVTRSIPPVEDVLDRDPDTVWMSPETSLWGWGAAARIHPGSGADRLEVVRRRLGDLVTAADVDDPL